MSVVFLVLFFCFFFPETSILFSMVAVPIYIPTNGEGGFPFPTPSPAFICSNGHSDWYDMVLQNSFDLHFSNT